MAGGLRETARESTSDDYHELNQVTIMSSSDIQHDHTSTMVEIPAASTGLEVKSPVKTEPVFTDQTNFLPTRQVIAAFLGLAVALCLSFLDQTM
jgi:hypothetical protein